MSNLGLEDGIKKLGYDFKRADVGDKYVSKLLAKNGWLLGGETSGHIICKVRNLGPFRAVVLLGRGSRYPMT